MPTRTHQLLTLICILTLIFGCGIKVGGHFTPASITLKEQGDLKELVSENLIFIDSSGTEWVAPRGTLTDGASVPRLALPVTDGRWDAVFLKAAVVHDAYSQQDNKTRTPDQYRTKPWKTVHRMFYEACITGGTPPIIAKIMYGAVRLAGPRWNDPDNELHQVSADILTRGVTGAMKWIEQNNPTVEEIEAEMNRREPLLLDFYKHETGIQGAFQDCDTTKAHTLLLNEKSFLERELENSPEDSMLLISKGYWHKNWALLYRQLSVNDKAKDELISSEHTFKAVIENEPENPGALNGLGSVLILRGDLDKGEEYVLKALTIAPNYKAAKNELQRIKSLRESQPPE